MLPSQLSSQDVENAKVALALLAASAVVFGRYLLRMVLALIAVALGVGVFVLIESMRL
jgi:hypothetical protein